MKELEQFKIITNKIANKFCKEYFEGSEFYWIAEDRTSFLCVNDSYFIKLEDMIYALKYNVAVKTFLDYYNQILDEEPKWNNLRHYINTKNSKGGEPIFFMPDF